MSTEELTVLESDSAIEIGKKDNIGLGLHVRKLNGTHFEEIQDRMCDEKGREAWEVKRKREG